MPITINGSGTITGVNVGGLPDGIVDTDMIANNAVTSAKSTITGGKVLQVQVGEYATAESSSSTSYVDTSLDVSITPASSSNKIYITSQSPAWMYEEPGTDNLGYFAIYSSAASARICEASFGVFTGGSRADIWSMQNFVYLDSPSTTSAITYTIQQKVINSGYQITHCHNNRKARIVAMEIAA